MVTTIYFKKTLNLDKETSNLVEKTTNLDKKTLNPFKKTFNLTKKTINPFEKTSNLAEKTVNPVNGNASNGINRLGLPITLAKTYGWFFGKLFVYFS